MSEETVSQQPTTPSDALAAGIQRHELDQVSSPANAAKKAAIATQAEPEQIAPKADLLDGIRQENSAAGDPDFVAQIEALKEAHEKADSPEEEEEEAETEEAEEQEEKPEQPQIPPEVKAVMDALGLEPEDLQDPRWQSVIAKELDAQSQTPEARQQAMTEHITKLQSATEQIYKGDLTEVFINDLTAVNQIADPHQRAEATTRLMISGAVNLMSQLLPEMLSGYAPQVIERGAPGLMAAFQEAQAANAWSAAGGDDVFEYGSAEMKEAISNALKANPWIDQIPSWNGQATAMVNVLKGQKYGPAAIREALGNGIKLGKEAGKREVVRETRIVKFGKAMGSGRSKGQFNEGRKNTDLHDAIVEYMKGQTSQGRDQ